MSRHPHDQYIASFRGKSKCYNAGHFENLEGVKADRERLRIATENRRARQAQRRRQNRVPKKVVKTNTSNVVEQAAEQGCFASCYGFFKRRKPSRTPVSVGESSQLLPS